MQNAKRTQFILAAKGTYSFDDGVWLKVGLEFIAENGGGAGVRLRKPRPGSKA
jgi:hypothetical protein